MWGAAWLYKATSDEAYLDKAKEYYTQFGISGATDVFSWDDKKPAVHVLMAELTGDTVYKDSIIAYCDKAINDEWSPEKSPGGMLWYSEWGSLRYASNTAFLCLQVRAMIKIAYHFLKFYYMNRINFNFKFSFVTYIFRVPILWTVRMMSTLP